MRSEGVLHAHEPQLRPPREQRLEEELRWRYHPLMRDQDGVGTGPGNHYAENPRGSQQWVAPLVVDCPCDHRAAVDPGLEPDLDPGLELVGHSGRSVAVGEVEVRCQGGARS